MYKVGVIGDKDSVYGFSAVGVNVFFAETAAEGSAVLKEIADDYAVILITEKLVAEMESDLQRYKGRPLPALIPIPGITGNTGVGLKNVSAFVEQAVGSDILPD